MKRSLSTPDSSAGVDLHAGPVQFCFEPAQLWARRFSCHGVELLRAVYPAVRDAEWNTLGPRVRWVSREIQRDRFALRLRARYGGKSALFEWDLRLDGSADGTIVYSATGTALKTFGTNRSGFCVLHPAEVAGTRCRIEHTDGRSEAAAFPRKISPHQPFFDIRAISHSPAPGVRVGVRMEGDVFEMEDQRNWTDASFKTYCRPLALPLPLVLQPGMTIEQRVEVRVTVPAPRRRPAATARARESIGCTLTLCRNATGRLPAIGLVHSPGDASAARAAGLRHLRIDLDAASANSAAQWTAAINHCENSAIPRRELAVDEAGCLVAQTRGKMPRPQRKSPASKLLSGAAITFATPDTKDTQRLDGAGASLEVTLLASASGDRLEALARHIAATPSAVPVRWLVLDRATGATTPAVFARVSKLWTRHRIAGDLGAGVSGDFVDFNRQRPIVAGVQFASFGIDPQVHAFDEASILETLAIVPVATAQARRISGGLPVSVAPLRFGAPRAAMPAPDDPRQRTNFGGVWALGCLAALAHAKADHVSFLLSRVSGKIPALAVLRACAPFEGNRVQRIESSDPRRACGFALPGASGSRILIANFLPETQPIRLAGFPAGKTACTALFGENTVSGSPVRIAGGRLALPGHAVVQLEISNA